MELNFFQLPKEDPLNLKSYLRKYRKQFIIQAVSGILYNTVIVAGPILLGLALDAAGTIEKQGVNRENTRTLIMYCFLFVGVTIFFQYARYIKRWYLRDMSNRIACDMRAGILSKALGQSMEQLDRESVGDLMSRTVGDVEQVVSTMQSTINEAWDTWLLMLSYYIVLLYYDPMITLVCSIPIPIAIYAAEAVRHPLYRFSTNARKSASIVNSHLQKTLNGITTLRLFGREETENERLKAYSKDQMHWSIKVSLLQTGMMPVYSTLASLGIIGVIGLGGNRVINRGWSLGHFTAFLTMFIAMSTRTWVAARVFNQFHAAKASWDRIKEKLDSPHLIEEVSVTFENRHTNDIDIVVKDMDFKYTNSAQDVLSGISFNAKTGAIIGITGPVGAGKSALATVLTGRYPYRGSIKILGEELREIHREKLTSLIAYSGQDSFLFSSTIEENITFGILDKYAAEYERLQKILYITALSDDMELFPNGIQTVVGEKGVRVSGGQKQRISLARALYADTPILILDDPFSAVDIGTEQRMIARMRQELKGKTIFLFSHRLDAFKDIDHILVLDQGRLVEQGNHHKLMEVDGIYQKIFSAQKWMEGEKNGYMAG
ncbi:ABC-type multidrug transport system fused ATPase/permease subunit [Anaerosolibacter carboniphilus]|uniref:ABC-type multidrug transport system fused ATPase/permease subunit n=1 Tax=Anaerosolibacter carboniphilus TaxID=1417629 RepID=A0A841KR21_9FIRM|nr:ABC transporter ATP-binding protein [Anaerosolibacter carboniphilus]MBB6216194.1 ABC-type multidrug transport system fused ATPase/permease subunit [Anaerosolibacter carboniphilus]